MLPPTIEIKSKCKYIYIYNSHDSYEFVKHTFFTDSVNTHEKTHTNTS